MRSTGARRLVKSIEIITRRIGFVFIGVCIAELRFNLNNETYVIGISSKLKRKIKRACSKDETYPIIPNYLKTLYIEALKILHVSPPF